MVRRKRQPLMTWAMALMMIVNALLPFGVAHAEGSIDQSVLTNLKATVTQEGTPIPEGGTITSSKPIRVDISFGVPVVGDDPTPANPVQKGDTVTFNLSNAFTLLSGNNIELKFGDLMVGHATFATDPDTKMVTATVTFDGDEEVFDGTTGVNTVTCQFGADFEYDASGEGGSTGNHTVTILEKSYTVNVPALPVEYDVTKTGTANLADQSITWTVYISGSQGGAAVDLSGYQFFDDLTGVGDYVANSFEAGSDSVAPTWDGTTKELSYTFPSGSTSPQEITFKTRISDDAYYATSEQKVSNTAQLRDSESTVVDEGQDEVKFYARVDREKGRVKRRRQHRRLRSQRSHHHLDHHRQSNGGDFKQCCHHRRAALRPDPRYRQHKMGKMGWQFMG